MEVLNKFVDAIPNSTGVEGHGQGVEYDGRTYYYRMPGKNIPKKNPTYLTWEGNFAGRVHGDKVHLIVMWEDDVLYLLNTVYINPQQEAKKYYGYPLDIFRKYEEQQRQEWNDRFPKCNSCGNNVIILDEGQPKDKCTSCFAKGIK